MPKSKENKANNFMTNERYIELSDAPNVHLTEKELADGWHWCLEFDGLLVGPGMSETKFCHCYAKDDEATETKVSGDDMTNPLRNNPQDSSSKAILDDSKDK